MYQDRFRRYGHPCNESEDKFYIYMQKPCTLNESQCLSEYNRTRDRIAELTEMINDLNEHCAALYDRYNELKTMPYTYRLEIRRHKDPWKKKITYHIMMDKIQADGTTERTLHETYEGQKRREALARFASLKKQHPGIEAVENIEP